LHLINVDADDLKTGSRVLQERGYVEFANIVLSDERLVNFDLSNCLSGEPWRFARRTLLSNRAGGSSLASKAL